MTARTVVVITGAAPLDGRAVAAVPTDAVVVAADGGLDHARAAGIDPAVLVGDLDSVTALGLAWASEHTTVVRHPIDKAATDTELAIAYAAELEPERIVLLAGQGDRLDHAVAALGALGAPALAAVGPTRGVVGRRPAARRPRPRVDDPRPPGGDDVLRALDARRRRGRHRRRCPLAAHRPPPRTARRARRQQPDRHATRDRRGGARRRHDHRPRSPVMRRLLAVLAVTSVAAAAARGMWWRRRGVVDHACSRTTRSPSRARR